MSNVSIGDIRERVLFYLKIFPGSKESIEYCDTKGDIVDNTIEFSYRSANLPCDICRGYEDMAEKEYNILKKYIDLALSKYKDHIVDVGYDLCLDTCKGWVNVTIHTNLL